MKGAEKNKMGIKKTNRCRNVRGSFTCHMELMNLFL
jgi:hypothetical protein